MFQLLMENVYKLFGEHSEKMLGESRDVSSVSKNSISLSANGRRDSRCSQTQGGGGREVFPFSSHSSKKLGRVESMKKISSKPRTE